MLVRNSARAVLLNEENEVLLYRFEFPIIKPGATVWVTPGGGLEDGEDYETALRKEIYEETGIVLPIHVKHVWALNTVLRVLPSEHL